MKSLSHVRICSPMDCSPPGSFIHGIFQQEYWSGLPFPSPGDLPDVEIEPGSPALQADAFTVWATREAHVKHTRVGSLSLLQGIFPTQGWNPGLPHCRWIVYQLSHKDKSIRSLQTTVWQQLFQKLKMQKPFELVISLPNTYMCEIKHLQELLAPCFLHHNWQQTGLDTETT